MESTGERQWHESNFSADFFPFRKVSVTRRRVTLQAAIAEVVQNKGGEKRGVGGVEAGNIRLLLIKVRPTRF